jgi:hypothetical protein
MQLEDDIFSEQQNSNLWSIAHYYNRNQLEFYTSYTVQPYAGDLSLQEFGWILNMVVPDLNLPLDKLDESKEGGAIMNQYLQDHLGFTPLSQGDMDKRAKVKYSRDYQ